jgi:hypothetical protein
MRCAFKPLLPPQAAAARWLRRSSSHAAGAPPSAAALDLSTSQAAAAASFDLARLIAAPHQPRWRSSRVLRVHCDVKVLRRLRHWSSSIIPLMLCPHCLSLLPCIQIVHVGSRCSKQQPSQRPRATARRKPLPWPLPSTPYSLGGTQLGTGCSRGRTKACTQAGNAPQGQRRQRWQLGRRQAGCPGQRQYC